MGTSSSAEGRTITRTPIRRAPLVATVVSSAVMAAGVFGVYLVMRWVGLENGGACASGGPYEIRSGQECQEGVFALAFGSIGAMVAGFFALLRSAWKYGGRPVVTSACGIGEIALFGGMGYAFLSVRSDLPPSADESGDFTFVGILFLVFAAIGVLFVAASPLFVRLVERTDMFVKPDRPTAPTVAAWSAWFAAVVAGSVVGMAITAALT